MAHRIVCNRDYGITCICQVDLLRECRRAVEFENALVACSACAAGLSLWGGGNFGLWRCGIGETDYCSGCLRCIDWRALYDSFGDTELYRRDCGKLCMADVYFWDSVNHRSDSYGAKAARTGHGVSGAFFLELR